MVAQIWPASLPQAPLLDGFSMQEEGNLSSFKPEIGQALVWPRGSDAGDLMSWSFYMTRAQVLTFRNFYRSTLNFGAQNIILPNFVTDEAGHEYQIDPTSPPVYEPITPDYYRVSFPVYRIPSAQFSAEALTYFAAAETYPSDERRALYESYIAALQDADIWDGLDILWLGGAEQPLSLVNMKSPGTFDLTNGGATWAADAGFTGNGASAFLATGFNPSTAGGNFALNSGSIFAWCDTSAQDTGAIIGHDGDLTSLRNYITQRHTDNTTYGRLNTSTDISGAGGGTTDGKAFWHLTRTGPTTSVLYKNGVSYATSAGASDALPNTNIRFLQQRIGAFSSAKLLLGGIGRGNTAGEAADLYAASHEIAQEIFGVA